MKCPLLAHKTYIPEDWPMQVYEDCLKEECAWWDSHHGKCSQLTLALSCDSIHHHLEDIDDKMPREDQFRK